MVERARENVKTRGLEDRVSFLEADVMDVYLGDASVVLCYLVSVASVALKSKFGFELRRGTRIVMKAFPIPGWIPDRVSRGR